MIRRGVQLNAATSSQIALRTTMDGSVSVDRANGVVRNVAVISGGVTKPSGNGQPPFLVDATSLSQVAAAINAAGAAGIKSRITHPELNGEDGITAMVGSFLNARVDGDVVRADFRVGKYAAHTPLGNMGEFVLGLSEEAAGQVGVSIKSDTAALLRHENPTGLVLRIDRLDAIDWVGDPAGNPRGLLSASPNQPSGASPVNQAATVPTGVTMKWNAAQLAWLRSAGLPENATDAEITSFVAALAPDKRSQLDGLGATGGTPAASAGGSSPASGSGASNPGSTAASAAPDLASVAASAAHAAVVSERARLSELNDIAKLAGMPGEWATQMSLEGKTPAEARQIALARKASGSAPIALGGSPSITVGDNLATKDLDDDIADAIMLRAGASSLMQVERDEVRTIGGRIALGVDGRPKTRQPSDRASQLRGHSVVEIGRRYLVSLGFRQADALNRPQLVDLLMSKSRLRDVLGRSGIALAHGAGDFPYLLADVMGKSLRQAYATASPTWPLWCRKATAPDFKAIKRLQLSEASSLESMEFGEEYTFGTMTESREQYSLGKYGKGISFTREMLINDDLDAFARVPTMQARAARRLEETTAIAILTANATMGDGTALFATAHGNLSTGTPSVLSLGEARRKMRLQTPLGGDASNPLELTPKVIIVPEELAPLAEQLVGSTVDPAKQNATPNLAFVQKLVVASSARLSASSAIMWYLAADYNEIDTVEMSFLEGEEGPTILEEDEFNTDVRKVKVRHYVAAKAIDHRGLVRSSGS